MSLQFSDTSNYKGIAQIYEKECGFERGFITGNTDRMKEFTADANLAHDDLLDIGFKCGGTWQLDDSNHTDYPFITTNLVASQRDYAFTTDGSGNLILDIMRVMVADSSGVFREIYPVDQQTRNSVRVNTDTLINGQNETGTPTRYEKTGNGILLDLIPSYNYTNGLKVFINREGSYFAYTDTTKKPGVPGLLHRWYAIKPASDYARRNRLANYPDLVREVELLKLQIRETFGKRERDIARRLFANVERTD